ncbi:MAG: Holliday junction branch migration protein RuvA [Gemmatimonadota bacterium]|nr:Holliday junction branch migration protein RuvA [Gemmatimonadota bacterium]
MSGALLTREPDRVEIETSGGVGYEIEIPLTVFQSLPEVGSSVTLRTVQVVTDVSAALYGFREAAERTLFQRLLGASGVGAKVALAMMSTYSVERLARALVEKDVTALQQVSGVGKKKAEKIALELSDKVEDLTIVTPTEGAAADGRPATQAAVNALVALGYTFGEADQAVRAVLAEDVPEDTDALIRRALAGRGA